MLIAGLLGFRFWIERPIGDGPAGPPVASVVFTRPWTDRPVLLLGLGDSVTAGFGATKGRSYFDRLTVNPPDEFPEMRGLCLTTVLPRLRVKNLAMSGSTSLDQMRAQLAKLEPADTNTLGIVVLTTGGNDIIHNYGHTPPREGAMYGATLAQARPWITAFEERLATVIRRLHEAFPGGCHVFLATIYDPTDGVGDIALAGLPAWPDGLAILREYNAVIERCGARDPSVHLVSVHGEFLGHGIHCAQFWRANYHRNDPHYWYFENLEDPNDRGYDAIRRLFLNAMSEALAKPGSVAPRPK